MFEVGKIYESTIGLRAKCLFAYESYGHSCMVGEVLVGDSLYLVGEKYPFSGQHWKEYHEPKIEKTRRYLARSVLFAAKDIFDGYDTVELTYTDGKLTDVEIIR